MKVGLYGLAAILVIGAVGGSPAARAQPAAPVHRIAVVVAAGSVADMAKNPFLQTFLSELNRLGYTEGHNLAVERVSGDGRRERYPDVARDVIRSGPHVIFATSGRVAEAIHAATSTIPIVTVTANPMLLRLAESLARPGGNVTGFTVDVGFDVPSKRLEILKEAVPRASRVAYLATRPQLEGEWGQAIRAAAARTGVTLVGVPLGAPIAEAEYRRAFAAITRERADALMVSDHGEAIAHQRLIVDLTGRARLPAIYAHREFVEAGGLMAYAVDLREIARGSAGYVDRILKGARPGDLPFQQPTKFELVVNRKTARALGLGLPASLLLRADHTIE